MMKEMHTTKIMGMVLAIVISLGLFVYIAYAYLPNFSPQKATDQTDVIYTNEDGGFSLVIPSTMQVMEIPTATEGGASGADVYLSFSHTESNAPTGLLVGYRKPEIEGKGGACVDENGESSYRQEVIANQTVNVCEVEGFRAEYFVNPNRNIEYFVQTVEVDNPDDLQKMKEIIRTSLSF